MIAMTRIKITVPVSSIAIVQVPRASGDISHLITDEGNGKINLVKQQD
jgi:hypothetical protein